MRWLDASFQTDSDVSLPHAALPTAYPLAHWAAKWALDIEWELELQALKAESLGWQPLQGGVYVHVPPEEPVPQQVCVVGLPSTLLQEQWTILLV